MNEKMKIEECIKKEKEHYEESLQRAVDAEVSPGHLVTDRYGRISFVYFVFNYTWGTTALLGSVEAEGYPFTHNPTSLEQPLSPRL